MTEKKGDEEENWKMKQNILLTYWPAYLLTDLLTHLLTYLINNLLAYLITYLLTTLLTTLLTYLLLLEKLTGSQLVKKFPAFYGTRRYITAFTSARHMSLS